MTNTENRDLDVTVLMSIYAKERVEYLHQALDSLRQQTWQNYAVIVVEDGALPEALSAALDQWQQGFFQGRIQRLKLSINCGLGQALNAGLAMCNTLLVARMDTDDVCEPERLEKQYAFFKQHPEIDIVSSALIEFSEDSTAPTALKPVHEHHAEIVRQFPLRNPINHPAVMFRREKILAAGGYQHLEFVEDYFLWARALQNGARFYNFPQPLLRQRFNVATVQRRGGLRNLINEWKVRYFLVSHGLCGKSAFLLGCFLQLFLRLGPAAIRRWLWQFSRKKYTV